MKKLSSSIALRVFLMLAVLALGAYLRFTGIKWDQDYHLHPDERFLTMVETSLSPVNSLKEYFDTSASSLNPHNILDANENQIYPFFVYGTLPIVIVRYLAEWFNMTGYGRIYVLGRILSGAFDLGTILLVYAIAQKLFKKYWLSLLAAFLYTCAVLPIQISHYFIVDNFTTFYSMLAFYFAVKVFRQKEYTFLLVRPANPFHWLKLNWRTFHSYIWFGVALGLASASKINALAIAVLLPLAVFLRNPKEFLRPTTPEWKRRFHLLILAAVVSFITFRIFQPYAFNGPGFFNVTINKEWLSDLRELSLLSSGISNYPPSLQWAKRSILFPLENLAVWGFGIPTALFALIGLLWMAWKIIRGNWRDFSLLWIWTFLYSAWQAVRWNPTMRYFLLVYPGLVIMAAWAAYTLTRKISKTKTNKDWHNPALKVINILIITLLVAGSALWSLAFIQIYRKPMTRVAASEWIYDNIEGAVNLGFSSSEGDFIQALSYPHVYSLIPGKSLRIKFQPEVDGTITGLSFDHVVREVFSDDAIPLTVSLRDSSKGTLLTEVILSNTFLPDGDSRGREIEIELDQPVNVSTDSTYELILDILEGAANLNFYGATGIHLQSDDGLLRQAIFESTYSLEADNEKKFIFYPKRDGHLKTVELFRVLDFSAANEDAKIIAFVRDGEGGEVLAQGQEIIKSGQKDDHRGSSMIIELDKAISLMAGNSYSLALNVEGLDHKILLSGSETAKETDWDDALPLYMYGMNPFDNYEGVYQSDLNFQMYWSDDEDKRQRFISSLDQADYIVITSSRQWGSVTQLPLEYPLTTYYYQALLGCPLDNVQDCYRMAQPGIFEEKLGFELVQVFQSNPEILGIEFNSQFAEEAFTVYDHPKVLIFKKTVDFNLVDVVDKLYSVDLDKIQHLNPAEAEDHAGDLMLTATQMEAQKNAGTWSQLFDYDALQNRYPVLTVITWYLFLTILGWIFYPLGRIIFKGLTSKGYALLKVTGLIIWSSIVWWLGSLGIPVSCTTILMVFVFSAILNLVIAWRNKTQVKEEIQENWRTYLRFEIIALVFFLFFLLIRLGNPDLWHPYKGGEKPMDFSYFNAVLKSEHFPPYDPWYAGGYINYYYYGFVLASIPVKLLGIVPSIAYNLILATFFSFTGMAAFTFGWNLFTEIRGRIINKAEIAKSWLLRLISNPYAIGITAALFTVLIGNLGTILMITDGFQKIALMHNPGLATGSLLKGVITLVQGFILYLRGASFSYYPGDWYWIPSRTIPGEPITEFPYFTFLYGDTHAHLFAYPITILVLCWIISLLRNKLQNKNGLHSVIMVGIGTLFIGTLKPTNTWDYPVYLFTSVLVFVYVLWRYTNPSKGFFEYLPETIRKVIHIVIVTLIFIGLTFVMYQPFNKWFGQAYSSIQFWQGDHTPVESYLVHWGVFLFILYSFLFIELRNWLAFTPLSALKPFYEKRQLITLALILLVGVFLLLLIWEVWIVLVMVPAALMLGMLFFRKDYSELKRFVILMALAGLGLTLMVELIVIQGDIGRMNTVFKFYLQAWTFLALASAYFLFGLVSAIRKKWNTNWRLAWQVVFGLLIFSGFLFPITASADKLTDRMSEEVALTLDGMEYMRTSTYVENEVAMDLSQDYEAIRWIQENISGTPVIIEGTISEYRWGNRYSIYTGLPGVIGWNWHQRQQRAINSSDWVYERVNDVNEFYSTDDLDQVQKIIERYGIDYIIVGQLEEALYDIGLKKFSAYDGTLWETVYSRQDTTIYKIIK